MTVGTEADTEARGTRPISAVLSRNRIGTRLVVAILLFSSAITLILTATDILFEYRGGVHALQHRLDEIERSYTGGLGEGLWNLDKRQLQLQAQGIAKLPDISEVQIREAGSGGSTPIVVTVGAHQDELMIARDIPLACACDSPGRTLGTLHLEATLTQIYRSLAQRVLFILASHAVKTMLVVSFILVITHRYVTRHIRDIAAGVSGFQPGGRLPPLRLRRPARHRDELDLVVDAFNTMSDRLARHDADRRQMEQERHARQVAEAANRAKSEFLASVSHEIRTPLNAIVGMSYLALRSGLNERQYNYVHKVHRSAHLLQGIIKDILDFSRIEAGKMQLETIAFDLDEVMDDVAAMTALQARQKGLELVFARPPRLPNRLLGDPLRLGQVLLNLVNNAIKFTERGRVGVDVEVVGREAAGVRLRFGVRDTGIGIGPEQQQRLFQPFSQADASTSRRYGGSGLGLAICRHLVQLMDGTIGLESAPGRGSYFHFTARLGEAAEAAAGGREALRADRPVPGDGATLPLPQPGREPGLSGARILLVEDNDVNRELAVELLEAAGIEVTVARDGRGALELLERQRFDGVLMDCQMPVMDGYEATRLLRRQPRLRELPVIAMTADAMVWDREKALAAGMNDHLAKPIDIEQLFATLARWLGRSGAQPPAAQPAAAPPHGDLPALLPGIDQHVGRDRTGGSQALYQRVLGMFARQHDGFGARFRAARAGADPMSALRMAHDLKSVAGTVGASDVQKAAAALERACAEAASDGVIDALVGSVERELAPVMAGLQALGREPGA